MLDPISVTVGVAIGTVAFAALSFALASRKDRRAREQMRRFAEMQTAVWAVQDKALRDVILSRGDLNALAPEVMNRNIERADLFAALQDARDRAAAAYFAAMGG